MAPFSRKVKHAFIISVYILIFVEQVTNFPYTDTRNVHQQVLGFYSNGGKSLKTFLPTEDQASPVSVLITLQLYSLDEFDTQTGEMELTATLFAEWKDETLATSIGNYSFTAEQGHTVFLPSDAVWTPNIRLNNAVKIHKHSYRSYPLRYNVYDGRILWKTKMKLKVMCKPDVYHYPFDIQSCDLKFSPQGYFSDEVQFVSTQSYLDTGQFTANGVSGITEVKVTQSTISEKSNINFSFQIERKSLFTIINMILPIILISILSCCVFLMPPRSLERIRLSTASFLSLVLFLRTILRRLPQSADPMPAFYSYVLTMMALNTCSVIATVCILRMYHKTYDSVSVCIQKITIIINSVTCPVSCQKTTSTTNYSDAESSTIIKPSENIIRGNDFSNIRPSTRMTLASRLSVTTFASSSKDTVTNSTENGGKITWSDVARAMNRLCFVVVLTVQCILSFVFILSLALTTY